MDGKGVALGSRIFFVVEPDCAVGAKVICVSCLGWMAPLDAVHSATCHHFTLAIEDEINFFRRFMMMGGIRTSRREVHPEKADHDIRLIDSIARPRARTCQELVQNRRG